MERLVVIHSVATSANQQHQDLVTRHSSHLPKSVRANFGGRKRVFISAETVGKSVAEQRRVKPIRELVRQSPNARRSTRPPVVSFANFAMITFEAWPVRNIAQMITSAW